MRAISMLIYLTVWGTVELGAAESECFFLESPVEQARWPVYYYLPAQTVL